MIPINELMTKVDNISQEFVLQIIEKSQTLTTDPNIQVGISATIAAMINTQILFLLITSQNRKITHENIDENLRNLNSTIRDALLFKGNLS